ncbi:hypothetical protein JCM10212_002007 [Sporobolomyces blumeae]
MSTSSNLTAEQERTLQENRLRAKAKFQERERAQHEASRRVNEHNKRPLQVIPADSTSPTNPNRRHVASSSRTGMGGSAPSSSIAMQNALSTSNQGGGGGGGGGHFQGKSASATTDSTAAPLKNMIGSYVEYDLSTLKNSRGGFLLEGEEDDPKKQRERRMQQELKEKRLENARVQGQLRGMAMSIDPKQNPRCVHCGTTDLDEQLLNVFGVRVCTPCKKELPDKYSLLTKTECKEDYLLTEPELKDTELMPHLLRPNPHRPTYSNMMLFLRCQVEAYAFSDKKWGSEEALDAEFERRERDKRDKKSKKFEKKLVELRKKTKTNVWHKRVEEAHVHEFVDATKDDGSHVQRCETCGVEVEVESF